jgi:tetratricopeptide (TPR) repeat protein
MDGEMGRASRAATILLMLAGVAWARPAAAHGSLHEQIEALSRRIARGPASAALYLQRGELRRAHRDWDAALADYDAAVRLDRGLAAVDLCRGLLLLEAGRPAEGRASLDRFLTRHPDHARARVARARASMRLGEPLVAAADLDHAIAHEQPPPPEHYLERARALAAAGRPGEAARGLEEGLRALGSVVTLQLLLIDIERQRGHVEAALARLDEARTSSPHNAAWPVRRGELLEAAGRGSEARDAYAKALAAIASLPPERRQVRATVALAQEAQAALERLGGASESKP